MTLTVGVAVPGPGDADFSSFVREAEKLLRVGLAGAGDPDAQLAALERLLGLVREVNEERPGG